MNKPIMICGEAWGEQENRIRQGFCGPSGIELLRMLNESGNLSLTSVDKQYISDYYKRGRPESIDSIWRLHHDEFYRTNVFAIHPPQNKLEWFCGSKADGIESYPALLPSKYVRREFEAELDRLADEIIHIDPNLIIALGNTALWALCGRTGVTKLRGTTQLSTHCASGYKLLPTYHPAAVLRQWELRPTTIIDLAKARREADFPDIRRPTRQIYIEPSLEDIHEFTKNHITNTTLLSVDIETSGTRVTCIGLAPNRSQAIVIPFDDSRRAGGSYWPTSTDEKQAWLLLRAILEDGSIPKLFHNGMYDVTFLWRSYGIGVRGCREDSMLLHHALQPESLKGLGYLGSVYCDEGAWKHMRTKVETIKRDN